MHGAGSPNGPCRTGGGGRRRQVASGADRKRWPAVCLGRQPEEIGSTVLAGKRIFHIGSARKTFGGMPPGRSRSSTGQSSGFLLRGLQVRILPGSPSFDRRFDRLGESFAISTSLSSRLGTLSL